MLPGNATVMNANKLETTTLTDIGSYKLSVTNTGGNTISISSEYIIEKNIIPPSKYCMLIEINKGMEKSKDAKIFIKM